MNSLRQRFSQFRTDNLLRMTGVILRGGLWLVLLMNCSAAIGATGDRLQFKRLFTSVGDNSSDNIGTVNVVEEDARGFIWMGGENGLARFDGHTLKIYRKDLDNPHSLPRNFIHDIVFDRQGVMWVATSAGLVFYREETDDFEDFPINRAQDATVVSRHTSSLAVDRSDNLIVGTHIGFAIVDAKRQSVQKFRHDPLDASSLSDDYVRKVYVDRNDRIWIGTSSGGLNVSNAERTGFRRFLRDERNPDSLVDNDVRAIAEDRLGRLWIGTFGGGLSRLDPETFHFHNYQAGTDGPNKIDAVSILDIYLDSRDTLWLATDHGGLARYRSDSDDFYHYHHSDYDATSISSNHVRSVFEDNRGDLWIGMFPAGVSFYDRSTAAFRNYYHRPDDPDSLTHSAVLSFFRDSTGVFWVGTENGLNIFDPTTDRFQRIYHDPKNPEALRYGTVLSIAEDFDGALWFGTWSGGLHRYDKATAKFKNYFIDPKNPGSISSKFIWHILRDSKNTLWIATEKGGLNRYVRETDSFVAYQPDPDNGYALIHDHVWSLLEDRRGNLWVATLGGLERFDRELNIFHHYQPNPQDPYAIRGIRITSLLEDEKGRIWIATQDEGLNIYDPETARFQNIGLAQGLLSNELSSLVQDDMGNIWVSGTMGIARVQADTLAVTNYTMDQGLVGNHFNRDASYRDHNGNIYFGGTSGFSVFHPSQLQVNGESSPLYITGLSILNRPVVPGTPGSPLQKSLLHTEHLTLTHEDVVFTLDYALLNYRAPQINRYAYQLEGFDKTWIDAGSTHSVSYTNMDPGTYTFRVKGANREGVWTDREARLRITVLPPLWLTWWAYAIYSALVLLAGYWIWHTQLRRMELEKEKRLNAQLVKVDRIKDAILANTSHELRTPLNSIVGLAESVCDGVAGEISATVREYLQLMILSGRRLTNLVDNVLDYASLTENSTVLNKRSVDLHSTVKAVLSLMQSTKGGKNIQLHNEVPLTSPIIFADEARLQQILSSLVENAIKHTDAGSVRVGCRETHNQLVIYVQDSGQGMSAEQVEHLFDPFHQQENVEIRPASGVGLGLAICKHLVDLHGGRIEVKSQPGQGTCFFIYFPLDENIVLPTEAPKPLLSVSAAKVQQKQTDKNHLEDLIRVIGDASAYTILVVDDDSVNRLVLNSVLSQFGFGVREAISGQQALDLLETDSGIDLILMDVMMPELSGYDTCKKIRERYSYFELPVIFLTAQKIPQVAVDGFMAGGNEFLTKPVSKHELLPRIANQLFMVRLARRPILLRE